MIVRGSWNLKCADRHAVLISDENGNQVAVPVKKAQALIAEIRACLFDYLTTEAFNNQH